MKKIINLIFLLYSISLSTSAQSLTVNGASDHNGIMIRWAPENTSSWNTGNINGYTVSRKTIAYQDTPFNIEQLIDSKVTLDSSIMVLSSEEFNMMSNDSIASVARMLIYDDTFKPVASEYLSLADALEYRDYIESKFIFSLLLSDQSFDIAKALGLGYKDISAQTDYTYQYTIKLNNDSISTPTTVTIKHSNVVTLEAPQDLKGEGTDLSAKLSWEIRSTAHLYNLYNIQRSIDNINFETVNQQPFTFISETEENPRIAYYSDLLPDNTTPFYYRIVGLSPFGIESLPSDTVSVTGKPPQLDWTFTLDSLYEVGEGNIRLDWRSISNDYSNKVLQFDIYTKASVDDQEIKLNSQPINPNQRTFDRINAPSDAYYRLEATDINGHIYTTLSYAGQVVDKTPPAAPQSTKGKILRDGTVVLSWSDNAEEDLLGYKVFYSNVKNGEYSTTVTEVNRDTFQIGNIDTSMDTDSIFYKVAAYDDRYNRSNFSEIISLARPDDVAPGKPLIAQVAARPAGIKISWILSNTPDVSQYTLQRKTVESTTWNNILSFSADDIPDPLPQGPSQQIVTNYIDQDPLDLRYYNYRLLAEDNFNNQSASPIKTVKPYDNLIRGIVQEFDASMNAVQNTNSQTNGNNSIVSTIGSTYDSEGIQITNAINSNVKLSWQYRSSNISPLKEFKVYMQTYKPSDPQMGEIPYILVNTISENKAETIALTQGYNGYMYVHNLAHIPGLQYNLKIMAYHTDGGFSEFTDSMAVPH